MMWHLREYVTYSMRLFWRRHELDTYISPSCILANVVRIHKDWHDPLTYIDTIDDLAQTNAENASLLDTLCGTMFRPPP